MSFAAVTAIVALHSTHWARRLLQRREEGPLARLLRSLVGIIATGLVVELALIPIAAVPLPSLRALRGRCEHHRYPAHDLRHHAA